MRPPSLFSHDGPDPSPYSLYRRRRLCDWSTDTQHPRGAQAARPIDWLQHQLLARPVPHPQAEPYLRPHPRHPSFCDPIRYLQSHGHFGPTTNAERGVKSHARPRRGVDPSAVRVMGRESLRLHAGVERRRGDQDLKGDVERQGKGGGASTRFDQTYVLRLSIAEKR